jgi:hypothetical protein
MSANNSQRSTPAAGKTCRCACKLSHIIRVVVLLILLSATAVVLYMLLTDSGQVMLGNIANKGFINWLLGEGDMQAENEAAAELEKCGVIVIKEQDKGVTSVDFSNYPKPTDESLKLITKLAHLTSVNLSNTEINNDHLAYLTERRYLNNLLLNETPITDAGLAHLVGLPDIRTLYMDQTKITNKGMEEIAKLTSLNVLNISHTGISDGGIKQIANMPNLSWLLIQGNNVTDAGIAEMCEKESLPELSRLSISKDMKISQDTINKLLKKYPKLQLDNYSPPAPVKTQKPESGAPPAAEKGKD